MAAAEGAEVQRHWAAQLVSASSAEQATRRMQEHLAALICICSTPPASPSSGAVAEGAQTGVCLSYCNKEATPALLLCTQSNPVSPIGAMLGSPTALRETGKRDGSPSLASLCAEGASPSPTRLAFQCTDRSPASRVATPVLDALKEIGKRDGSPSLASLCAEGISPSPTRLTFQCSPVSRVATPARARSVGSSSTARKSSGVVSSPLAPSPLTPLAEASPTHLDDCSPESFRAHSLSYSGEKPEAPQAIILARWSDDANLVKQLSTGRVGGPLASRQPAARQLSLGRGAPRGGRQPRRMRLEVDSVNRLPEFVSRRLQKAHRRSTSTGAL